MSKGFTLIELLVVIGIFALLLGLAAVSYLSIQRRTDLGVTSNGLVATLREVQTFATAGYSADASVNQSAGVYLEPEQYTLFFGNRYNPTDSRNVTTKLPSPTRLSWNTTSSEIVFAVRSGSIINPGNSPSCLTLTRAELTQRIGLNRLGVIDFERCSTGDLNERDGCQGSGSFFIEETGECVTGEPVLSE